MWLPLERQLARRSTSADRELLIDLAQHPEKRDPPLRWGLQYIVRGDVMMPDGSVRRLDDCLAQHGVSPLAFLDEMRDQLDPKHFE